MLIVELVAAIFGALSVYFYIVRNHWSWPVGFAQVVLYIAVFAHVKLYADMLLHVIYAGVQIYGWHAWLKSRKSNSLPQDLSTRERETSSSNQQIVVRKLRPAGNLLGISIALSMAGMVAWLLSQFTDAVQPVPDSAIAGFSLVAQTLLAWRYLDHWRYWIFVDMVAIVLFTYKELYITAALYLLFLFMAIWGDRSWRRVWRESRKTEPAPL